MEGQTPTWVGVLKEEPNDDANSSQWPAPMNRFSLRLFLKQTVVKFFDDNGLFLASGLAFDLLLFCIPFSLLVVSLLAYVFGSAERAIEMLQTVVQELLPLNHEDFSGNLAMIVDNRGLLGMLGCSLFFLTSSLTFGSVRTVLDTIFHVRNPPSFFNGKAWDVLVTLIASGLLILTIAFTSLLSLMEDRKSVV